MSFIGSVLAFNALTQPIAVSDIYYPPGLTLAHQPAHSSNPKANFTLVPRISAETYPINVKERPNILLVSASC